MKTLAIYAGSFNPFHIGHLNIVEKAERIFGPGSVLIAIGVNPEKCSGISDDHILRANEIEKTTGRNVEVYSTFLHELIEKKELEGHKVVLIRGLRNGDDLNYEDVQLKFINDFKKDIDVIFIKCDSEFNHISSSSIRSLQSFRPGSGDKYLI